MNIWSLGGGPNTATWIFNQPFLLLSGGSNSYNPDYFGPLYQGTTNSGYTLSGAEGWGTIEFLGTFTNFTWITPGTNDFTGYTFGVSSASALQPFIWQTNTGDWIEGTNWQSGAQPGSSDMAYIDNGGTAILSTNGTAETLYVGYTNTNVSNSLIITNGGNLSVSTNLFLGFGTNINGNSATVFGNSTLSVGATNYVGYAGSSNSLTVTGTNALVSTPWLMVGYQGSNNRLTISNGAVVSDGNGIIGFTNSATGNSVLVTGSNSLWSNSQTGNVGYGSSSNSLVISNGGKVVSGATFYIGYNTNNNYNSVQVAGSNSVLSIANPSETIYIGLSGSFNSLSITDGGKVVSGYGVLGNGQGANSNSVLVSGTGSIWTNTYDVIIGQAGSGNLLTISNGGKVYDRNGFLDAPAPGASNNVAIVNGSSSLWSNSGTLYVGTNGNGNRVVITNGGTVVASNTAISSKASDTNNSILITGQGSLLSNSGTVTVAAAGSGSLVLDQGGSLVASNITVNATGLLTGNGTITTTSGTRINGGTFAPTGTNALTVNGNLTFTNSAIYVWNLFNNSTSATGGTNFTVTSILNNGLLSVSGSTFNVVFGTNVSSGVFWSNNESWTIMTGVTNGAGTNFTLGFLGNTNGITQNRFSLVNSNGSLNLVYTVPVTVPTFYWGTNTQSWGVAANWSSNQVPLYSNNAFIDNGGTSEIGRAHV